MSYKTVSDWSSNMLDFFRSKGKSQVQISTVGLVPYTWSIQIIRVICSMACLQNFNEGNSMASEKGGKTFHNWSNLLFQ